MNQSDARAFQERWKAVNEAEGSGSEGLTVSETTPPAPFLVVLKDLLSWLGASHVEGVVIGGVAASLLGRPRTTRDVDVLVFLDEARWGEFLETGSGFGFRPRRGDALAFARRNRVLLVSHEPSGLDVDLVFGALPYEREVIAASRPIRLEGTWMSRSRRLRT